MILLDILMPGMDGLEVLERMRAVAPVPQVIMLTATKTVKTAVQAMKLGAFDYVTKPFDVDELLLVGRARRHRPRRCMREVTALRQEVGQRYSFDNVIGSSPADAGRARHGQPGGAAAHHRPAHRRERHRQGSDRQGHPLQQPARQRSAGGDQLRRHPGERCSRASCSATSAAPSPTRTRASSATSRAPISGTIFLDEIGEMNPGTQAKLLRVLEQGAFTRVGGSQPVTVDVRVIAATNRDLDKSMQDGTFRPDLYFRLNVVAIHLPPLRERREDLPLLIHHFLAHKAAELGVAEKRFERDALDCLLRYAWPGNVRELENVVERALALSQTPTLTARDLPAQFTDGRNAPVPAAPTNGAGCVAPR